ncbi:MAG: phosphotransferase [Bryobacterales bacterium]|nr:phosphotransferase [Bryobacterales bacterium]
MPVPLELDGPDAAAYLAAQEQVATADLRITPLGGGVSNHVLLIESPRRRAVVKQSLGKLRVEQDWFSRRDRIWREAEALRALPAMMPAGSVPTLLWEDRDNYALAMSCAPGECTWKSVLMSGEATEAQAQAIGRMHRALLDHTADPAALSQLFLDQEAFDELRLDPYYRTTATRHPDLAAFFETAIERCRQHRTGLVHGDWSPKNLMVDSDHVTAIDFEVIHYGDPGFDTAFLLNHLLLKSVYKPHFAPLYEHLAQAYWNTLQPSPDLIEGTFAHLPLLLLARVDGKSPAEYLTGPAQKEAVRRKARRILASKLTTLEDAFAA